MNEVTAALILSHAPFLGPSKIGTLLEMYGSFVEALAHAPHCKFRKETLLYLENFENETGWQQDLARAAQEGVALLPYTDPRFPERMKRLSDCPPLLYIKGALPSFDAPWIAIVGTRAATPYALDMAERLAADLGRMGAIVVSGLARGIDTAAHIGSLKASQTVAVIGSGLSHIYPTENIPLAREIAARGAVVSEFEMNTTPTRFTFPKRNRLIAALGEAVLLIEAPLKSGAMITMHEAERQNKKLFAISHRSGQEQALGNHFLIKKNKAMLIDQAHEIMDAIGYRTKNEEKKEIHFIFANDFEKKIHDLLKAAECTREELSEQIQLPIHALQAHLTRLQIKKIILELPGKRYRLSTLI